MLLVAAISPHTSASSISIMIFLADGQFSTKPLFNYIYNETYHKFQSGRNLPTSQPYPTGPEC